MLDPEVQKKLLEAARAMAIRLRMYKTYQKQARDLDEEFIDVNLLWEPADQEALDLFDAVTNITCGEQGNLPLS